MRTIWGIAAVCVGLAGAFAPPASAQRSAAVVVRYSPQISGDCRECDFSSRVLPGFMLQQGAELTGVRFVNARISALHAEGVGLEEADFSYAELPDARFAGAMLREARFRMASAPRANFAAAVLRGADFTGAKLEGADLESAIGLTQAQLDVACGDAETRLPEGLEIPHCEKTVAAAATPEAPLDR